MVKFREEDYTIDKQGKDRLKITGLGFLKRNGGLLVKVVVG